MRQRSPYRRHPLDRQPPLWPIPRAVVLEDRSTGTVFLLSHDAATDTVSLTTPVPARAHSRPTEPVLRGARRLYLRLFVDNGVLAREVAPSENPAIAGPVFTINYGDLRIAYKLDVSAVTSAAQDWDLIKHEGIGREVVLTTLPGGLSF